jgi:hypothetical protein
VQSAMTLGRSDVGTEELDVVDVVVIAPVKEVVSSGSLGRNRLHMPQEWPRPPERGPSQSTSLATGGDSLRQYARTSDHVAARRCLEGHPQGAGLRLHGRHCGQFVAFRGPDGVALPSGPCREWLERGTSTRSKPGVPSRSYPTTKEYWASSAGARRPHSPVPPHQLPPRATEQMPKHVATCSHGPKTL